MSNIEESDNNYKQPNQHNKTETKLGETSSKSNKIINITNFSKDSKRPYSMMPMNLKYGAVISPKKYQKLSQGIIRK